MAKHHILAFFTASILSRYLIAAAPVLGPEVPLVSGIALRSAAYDQTAPAAASNGNDYLVAWVDGRRLSTDVYVSRVKTDGRYLLFMRSLARTVATRNRAVGR